MHRHHTRASLALGLLAFAGVGAAHATTPRFRALHPADTDPAGAPIVHDLRRSATAARTKGKKEGYLFLAREVAKAADHHREAIPPAFYEGLGAVLDYAALQAGTGGFLGKRYGKARDSLIAATGFVEEHLEGLMAGGVESFQKALWMGLSLLPEYGSSESRWMLEAEASRFALREDLVPNPFSRAMLQATAEVAAFSDDKTFHFALRRPFGILVSIELDARSFSQMGYYTADFIRDDALAARVMRHYLAALPEPPHAWGAYAIEGFEKALAASQGSARARREQVFAVLQFLHYGEGNFKHFCALPLQMPFEKERPVFPVEMVAPIFAGMDLAQVPEEHRAAVARYLAAGNGIALRSLAVDVALNKKPCGQALPWGYYYR
jgi:hypothetical protein